MELKPMTAFNYGWRILALCILSFIANLTRAMAHVVAIRFHLSVRLLSKARQNYYCGVCIFCATAILGASLARNVLWHLILVL